MPRRSHRALLVVLGSCLLACSKKPDPKLVYVSAESSGEIVVVDPDHGAVVARIAVGKRPRGLVVSPDGRWLYVALSGSPRGGPNVKESELPPADRAADGIGVVDLNERNLLRTLPSGQDPESFDLSRDGKTLYVSNEETAELSVLDLSSGKLTRKVPVGQEPEGVTLRPDGKAVYVTSEQDSIVTAIGTVSFAVLAQVATGRRPRAICFTKDGRTGFVSNELDSTVTVFAPHTHQVLGVIKIDGKGPVGARPMGLTMTSDDKWLFVSTGRGGAVAVVDVGQRKVERLIEGVGARPWGIALSHDGTHAYTANGPSDDLAVIDVKSGKLERKIPIGGSPWGAVTGK